MAQATERKSVITTTITPGGPGNSWGAVTFHIKGAGDLHLDLSKVAEEIRARAMVHGFIQRISDKAAIPCDTTTGLPATPAMKLEAMRGMVEHFMSGSADWNVKRAEGTRKPKDGLDPIIIAAVCEVTGKDEAAIRATIAAGATSKGIKPAQFLAALANAAKVRVVVERLRAEAAPDLDGDALLEGMGE